MQQLVEHGSRQRRIGALVGAVALVAVAGLAAAHFAGFSLPLASHTPAASSSEAARAAPIGGPMISTQILEHPIRTDRHTQLAVPATRASDQARPPVGLTTRPQLAVALIRHEPAPSVAPTARPKAPAIAHRLVPSGPAPSALFAPPHRLMTPAELCAQTDRPERCVRRIYRERHGVYDTWRPDDGGGRGDGYGEGWRRWGGDEDDDDDDD